MGVSPALFVGVLATVVGVAVEPVLGELPPQAATSMIMLNKRRKNQMLWPGKFFSMVFSSRDIPYEKLRGFSWGFI